MLSLVLLRTKQKQMTADDLAGIVNRTFGVKLGSDDPDATEFAVGESPIFMIKFGGRFIMVHNHPRQYFDDTREQAKTIRAASLREAFLRHKAWLSVDVLPIPDEVDREEAYRLVGKLIAALADEDSLVLYAPETGEMIKYEKGITAVLTGDDPLSAFETLPTISVADDDPRMLAAIAEARRRFPEFVKAFRERQGQGFSVKAPFAEGQKVEHIWLSVKAIDETFVDGILDNDPVDVTHVRLGDKVKVKVAELSDWMYVRDGKPVGGFSVKILAEVHSEKNP